ncbi:MAG: hypothetical protein A2583_14850 [Bdellovibrionales bacterium RIFOXYD1_FULL_53_11]|nr:MAG: hypothetical protein A2583_14850 [Bdellovibrionales bacterium RIFOXYD1_FULL_53_11]
MKFSLKYALAVLLVLACVPLYAPWKMENTSGDNISLRYWPLAVLKHGSWNLNPFRQDLGDVLYASINIKGTLYPMTYFSSSLFTFPVFAVADKLDIGGTDWNHDRISIISRLNAFLIAVAAGLVLFFLFCRLVPVIAAFAGTAVFAFGSWHWSLGAQGLSSQLMGVSGVIGAMYALWRFLDDRTSLRQRWWALAFGFMTGLVFALRPHDALLLSFGVFVMIGAGWRVFGMYAAGMLVPVLSQGLLHLHYYGFFLGFFGLNVNRAHDYEIVKFTFHSGIAGLLVSPNRGAIVFFPLLILAPYLWYRLLPPVGIRESLASVFKLDFSAWNPGSRSPLGMFTRVLALGAIIYFIAISGIEFWHSTWSYGPRYLYELVPATVLAVAFGVQEILLALDRKKTRISRIVMLLLVVFALQGVAVHWLGHGNYDLYVWNSKKFVDDSRAWNFNDLMLGDVIRAGSNDGRYPGALYRLKKYGF